MICWRTCLSSAVVAASVACSSAPQPENAPPVAVSTDPRVGTRVHITGCTPDGRLDVPIVNLWDSPERTCVIGELSGNGRADQGLECQGSIVVIRDVRGRLLEVETVVGDKQRGWVTEPFIGKPAS